MPQSNSVIRRYTPPTCTLEILAQSSPLSHWMGKAVIKQLSFELRFDDPRLPEERRISIQGDRDQLEALYDAVTSYAQEFLQQSPDKFWVSFSGIPPSNQPSDEPESENGSHSSPLSKNLKSFPSEVPRTQIHLEPSSYLTHNLFLGSLANQTSGPVIQLGLLQLFDLATALDEYSADVIALPTLNRGSYSQSFPTWAPVAAMLVLAVGLTPFTWQYANSIRQKQQQQQLAKTSAPEAKVALQPSPPLNFPNTEPRLTPPANLQSIDGSSTTLNPETPLPATSSPLTPLTVPNSTFSRTANLSPQKKNPELSINTQLATQAKIPNPQIAIPANPQQNTTRLNSPSEITLSTSKKLPIAKTNVSPNISQIPSSIATISNDLRSKTPTSEYPPLDPRQLEVGTNTSDSTLPVTTDNNQLVEQLRTASKKPVSTGIASSETLFDTPQVTEAREYLKKRWQPPAGLKQTLEYSLTLNFDGSIDRILPLNQAARENVDSAGIPAIGKPFVSANKSGQNVRIRVVLSPDGKVQTFPESQ